MAALSAHPITAPLAALLPDVEVLQLNIAVSSGGVVPREAPMCGWGAAPCAADVQPFGASRPRSAGRFAMQICRESPSSRPDCARSLADGCRLSDDTRPAESDPEPERTSEMLYVYRKAVRSVEASAPRWRVESHEALIFVSPPPSPPKLPWSFGIIITFIFLRCIS